MNGNNQLPYPNPRIEAAHSCHDFLCHELPVQTELPSAPNPAPSSHSPFEEFVRPVLVFFCVNCHSLNFYQCVFVIVRYFISVAKCLGVPVKN